MAMCGAERREELAQFTLVDDAGRRYRLVTPWRSVTDASLWAPTAVKAPPARED
jgi:hypothetical protein